MKTSALLSVIFLISTFTATAQVSYRSKVEFLTDNYKKTYFLKSAYEASKDIKEYEDSVMLATGFRSEEHLLAIDSLQLIDSILTEQMDKYLTFHNHPKTEDFSEIPRVTPLHIMNQSANKEKRLKHFSKFYQAYENGDLESRRLLNFLEREYKYEFRKSFQSYSRGQERIAELVDELDLMPARSLKWGLFK